MLWWEGKGPTQLHPSLQSPQAPSWTPGLWNQFENLRWSLYLHSPKPRLTGQKVTQGHTENPDCLGLTPGPPAPQQGSGPPGLAWEVSLGVQKTLGYHSLGKR